MKKLVKTLLAEVKKEIGLILLIPFLLSLASYLLFALIKQGWLLSIAPPILGLSFLLSLLSYGAIPLISLSKDYKAFFGEGASFYSALPLSPGQVLASRYLYYLIIGLVSLIIGSLSQGILAYSFFHYLNKIGAAISQDFSFMWLWQQVSSLPLHYYLLGLLALLISIFYRLSLVIFSLSFGSEKRLQKLGIGGPIVTYFASSLIVSLVTLALGFLTSFIIPSFKVSMTHFVLILESGQQVGNSPGSISFLFPYAISLAFGLFFCYRSYLSHKKKLSVY